MLERLSTFQVPSNARCQTAAACTRSTLQRGVCSDRRCLVSAQRRRLEFFFSSPFATRIDGGLSAARGAGSRALKQSRSAQGTRPRCGAGPKTHPGFTQEALKETRCGQGVVAQNMVMCQRVFFSGYLVLLSHTPSPCKSSYAAPRAGTLEHAGDHRARGMHTRSACMRVLRQGERDSCQWCSQQCVWARDLSRAAARLRTWAARRGCMCGHRCSTVMRAGVEVRGCRGEVLRLRLLMLSFSGCRVCIPSAMGLRGLGKEREGKREGTSVALVVGF